MEMSGRKGILMTLITLILFLFMLAEILTYVSLNLNNNSMAMQISQTESTSLASSELNFELYSFIHSSMMNSLSVIYSQSDAIERNITDQNATASEMQQLITTDAFDGTNYQSSIGITLGNYISSIESESSAEQEPISILNSTFRVFQNAPLSLTGVYTGLAVIKSNGTESTYPISIKISVPSTSPFDQAFVGALPPEITSYVPVKITNTQSSNTASPFQQKVIVNSSLYRGREAGNLDNIEFFYANDSIVHSWLESGNTNTSTNTTYWLNISAGISAHSSITVYMGFANLTTNLLNNQTTGEAPQLSSTYAQYDNGASVFNNYFAGDSLTGWTVAGTAGETATAPSGSPFGSEAFYANGANGDYLYTIANDQSGNMIIEYYTYTSNLNDLFFLVDSAGAGQMMRVGTEGGWYGIASTASWTSWSGPSNTGSSAWGDKWLTTGIVVSNGNAIGYLSDVAEPYGTEIGSNPTTSYAFTDNGNYIGFIGDAASSTTTSYLNGLIVRAYPPNGVMPTAVVGG